MPNPYIDLSHDSIAELYRIAVSGKKTRVVENFDAEGRLTSRSSVTESSPKLAAQSLMMADVILDGALGVNAMIQAIHGKVQNHLSRPKKLAVDVNFDVVSNAQAQIESVKEIESLTGSIPSVVHKDPNAEDSFKH